MRMSESKKGHKNIKKILFFTRMIWMYLTVISYLLLITNSINQTLNLVMLLIFGFFFVTFTLAYGIKAKDPYSKIEGCIGLVIYAMVISIIL